MDKERVLKVINELRKTIIDPVMLLNLTYIWVTIDNMPDEIWDAYAALAQEICSK